MSRYFVTMLGGFTESSIRDMSFLMIPMISDHNLKFHYNEHSIVFHFQTDWDFQNVHSYCNQCFSNVCDIIIISDSESTKLCMEEDMYKEIMDLETETESSNLNFPVTRQVNGEDLLAQDLTQDDDEDEEDDFMMKLKSKKPKVPTLDEILDKICEKGIDSLTDNEKFILSKHSK